MRLTKPLVLTSFLLAAACRSAPPENSEALILKTYDVPKGSARSMVSMLDSTFWVGEQQRRLGRAAITPDGRLAVFASANVHSGVQSLVDEVAKHPPTFDQSIELHYFLVVGKAAASPQPPPAGVAEIQPALDEIAKTQGPQTFNVVHRARLTTLNGESGKVEADKLKITQKAAVTNDGVDAIIGLDFSGNDKLDSRVHLTPDRIVVLGATGQRSDPSDGTTLYYVVRVAPRGKQP